MKDKQGNVAEMIICDDHATAATTAEALGGMLIANREVVHRNVSTGVSQNHLGIAVYKATPVEVRQAGGFAEDRFKWINSEDSQQCHWSLPDWELKSLEDHVTPENWKAPDDWWYQIKDGIETKKHQLDAILYLHFEYESTKRRQVADALRHAQKDTWVRLPCMASFVHDERGNEVVNHSKDDPPFRTTSSYRGLTMMRGEGSISQVRAFHGTQTDSATSILRSPFFTAKGGAGSSALRKRFGNEFPVTCFKPNFSNAVIHAEGGHPMKLLNGPRTVAIVEVLLEAAPEHGNTGRVLPRLYHRVIRR